MKRSTRSTAEPEPKVEPHAHPARKPPVIDPAALEAAAGFFRAAGDVARLRLLVMLREGEQCVSEIAETMDEGLSTVSQRLKVLRGEGLVARRRDGKHILYSLADEHVTDLVDNALAHAREHRRR